MTEATVRRFLLGMAAFWLPFGLITTFKPELMDMFQTAEGVAAKTPYSDHVWMHGGLDILSVCVLVFAISRLAPTKTTLRLVGVAGLLPVLAIAYSLVATTYWNSLFIVAGVGCLSFAVAAFVLAGRLGR